MPTRQDRPAPVQIIVIPPTDFPVGRSVPFVSVAANRSGGYAFTVTRGTWPTLRGQSVVVVTVEESADGVNFFTSMKTDWDGSPQTPTWGFGGSSIFPDTATNLRLTFDCTRVSGFGLTGVG